MKILKLLIIIIIDFVIYNKFKPNTKYLKNRLGFTDCAEFHEIYEFFQELYKLHTFHDFIS